jgi:hypothetical protein
MSVFLRGFSERLAQGVVVIYAIAPGTRFFPRRPAPDRDL